MNWKGIVKKGSGRGLIWGILPDFYGETEKTTDILSDYIYSLCLDLNPGSSAREAYVITSRPRWLVYWIHSLVPSIPEGRLFDAQRVDAPCHSDKGPNSRDFCNRNKDSKGHVCWLYLSLIASLFRCTQNVNSHYSYFHLPRTDQRPRKKNYTVLTVKLQIRFRNVKFDMKVT